MIKCVIIEDEPKAKDVLERYIDKIDYLELIGYCRDGVEALEMLPVLNPDLIFLDINMPNMDGTSLLRRIKASPKLHDLPVLVVSSVNNAAKESELLKDGAFAVISKPISPAAVAQTLQSLNNQSEWG